MTAALERTPPRADQAENEPRAGRTRQHYPRAATHLVTFVAYGLPYFDRLPGAWWPATCRGWPPTLAVPCWRRRGAARPTSARPTPGSAKLQFTIFVPTAEFFRTLRTSQASLDPQEGYGVAVEDNGLERFLTATRQQNFLVSRAATAPSP